MPHRHLFGVARLHPDFDRSFYGNRQRIAFAVDLFADGNLHPTFRDAIFFDIGFLDPLSPSPQSHGSGAPRRKTGFSGLRSNGQAMYQS